MEPHTVSAEAVKNRHDHVPDWLAVAAWVESGRRGGQVVHFDPHRSGIVV